MIIGQITKKNRQNGKTLNMFSYEYKSLMPEHNMISHN